MSSPVKHLPHPPVPATPHFSSNFPQLPAPIPSGPPDHIPHPPQRSSVAPDLDSEGKLFYKTYKPKNFLPTQRSTPASLIPALVRRSLPARLTVTPTPLEALPVLKSSCLSSLPPHQQIPTHPYIAPLPERSTSLDPFQSVQQPTGPTPTLSKLPRAFVDHPSSSVLSQPPPCHSPSSSLSTSPSASSSSPSVQFSSSSSALSSPSSSSSLSPSIPPSLPLFPSPVHSSPSPCLPTTYLGFPSPIPPGSSSFMISSSFPPLLHSPFLCTSPSSFIPIHPFNPPHWGKKVEKRREASGVEKKEIEKKKLKDDNFKGN